MIIEAFNLVFILYLSFLILLTVLIWYFLKDKSEQTRKWFIIGACLFNIVFFFIYKGFLSVDKEFIEISNLQKFSWWSELPLQLCNINMFIIPVSLIWKKKFLMGFSFFIAPLGAVMALMFPEPAFAGYNFFLMRNIGFYMTHGLLIVLGISLSTLRFFKPNFKLIPKILLTLVVLSLAMHGFNSILRSSICPQANYFFTYPADISILTMFYKWLPVPYLYLVFGVIILGMYMTLVTTLFLISKNKTHKIN
jgi:uncharacterized membrane protein YwaF